MKIRFKNSYLEKLFEGKQVPGKPKFNTEVILKFKKTVLRLMTVNNVRELKSFKGLNFEALKGDLKGFYSVRVDKSYRLILTLDEEGEVVIKEVLTIHDLNNHYQ